MLPREEPGTKRMLIDVDGIEHKVIEGAQKTISVDRLKSILIELNSGLEQHLDLIAEITALGYALDAEQLYAALRKENGFKNIGNYIFSR